MRERRCWRASLLSVALFAVVNVAAQTALAPTLAAKVQEPLRPRQLLAGLCPEQMALIAGPRGNYCIDRYEASLVRHSPAGDEPWPGNRPVDGVEAEVAAVSRPGVKPQGYMSGIQAEAACRNSGKRLCEADEWSTACRGPQRTLYPYGNARRANVCNDRFDGRGQHPVQRLFRSYAAPGDDPRLMWSPRWMNDPRLHELPETVEPTGSFPGCSNEYGVVDMVGNLHEWVADRAGTFLGGFFMDTFRNGEGCEYRTTAHAESYHDYSTGFRCCAPPISRDPSLSNSSR